MFSNVNTSQVIVSQLIQGTYTFRLVVTDNTGNQAFDDIVVTVNKPSLIKNIALNKPIIASSIQSGLPANWANDGDLNTR